jgi:hypothetical protein
MKIKFFVLTAVLLFGLRLHADGAEPSKADEQPVTKVLTIKVPGKVDSVFWSVKSDLCTVQISFPSVRQDQKQPEHSRTQVWLLKADGTTIPLKSKPPTVGISNGGWNTFSDIYTFAPSAQTEAIAVVVSIDDQIFVERLTPNVK